MSESRPSLEVLSSGPQSSVQDLGWRSHREFGLSDAGALDQAALRMANALVGNPAGAAGIEVTWGGAAFRATSDLGLAVVGAELTLERDGHAIARNRAFQLKAGQVLRFGTPLRGARCMVAVAGGIDVATVLGARSTQLRAGFGGHQGRALRRGDCLPVSPSASSTESNFSLSLAWLYPERPIRLVPGRDFAALSPESQRALTESEFKVGRQSDRMGLRIAPSLFLEHRLELYSEPLLPGTLQLPPGGEPIVLTRDCQSTGGYPRIAHVIRADWDRLGQLRPGDPLRFAWIEADAARVLEVRRERALLELEAAVRARRAC